MRRSILSINGNKPMNYLLQTVISERYDFISASDVFQGVNELKRKPEIELIIIDVDYHTPDSWNFIQHIKTSGLYQDKQIIVLINGESRKVNEKMPGAKEYNFFYKPFSPLDMIKTIDELMFASTLQN
jgi:DNA-binding NtrC family response regulator